MPVSDVNNISPILRHIQGLQPQRILDLGIGMGKYGALAREVLDYTYGRFEPQDWKTEIVGYEGFPEYENPMWSLYDKVHVSDFVKQTPIHKLSGYHLVLMVDSLEHLDDQNAETMLSWLRQHNKQVLVSCPNGDYPQGDAFGNELERHRSVWTERRMLALGGAIIHRGVCSVAVFTR